METIAKSAEEGEMGQEYEPCIFPSLNIEKVMLTVGTDCEHFNAV